jgi:glycosyltransferase involved in cell wall biosynthesis
MSAEGTIQVSIIIPVYDSAEYLRRCFDSCVYQTLRDTEVIAVNDCSPNPRDAEIMREYERMYPDKFRCIFHKKNKRQGGARNSGIKAARGAFLQFVDSDDYIALNMCERMYTKAAEEGSDMVVCECLYLAKGQVIRNWNEYAVIRSQNKAIRLCEPGMHSCWRVLVKKETIVDKKLYFPENIFYEDFACCLWHIASEKIAYVQDALYYYILRYGSTTNPENSELDYVAMSNIFDCVAYVLESEYFNALDDDLKAAVFIYLLSCFLLSNFRNTVTRFPERIIEWCDRVQDIREIYTANLNDTAFVYVRNGYAIKSLLHFLDLEFNKSDFAGKAVAYVRREAVAAVKRNLAGHFGRSITIWGAGVRGERLAGYLFDAGIPFNIVDSDSGVCGKIVANKIVGTWEEYARVTDVIIVSPLYAFDQVKTQINTDGIEVLDFRDLL